MDFIDLSVVFDNLAYIKAGIYTIFAILFFRISQQPAKLREQFLTRLETNHNEIWQALGSPRQKAGKKPENDHTLVNEFIMTQTYKDLEDEQLNVIGAQMTSAMKTVFRQVLLIVVAVFLVYLWGSI